jgi:PAS domain S-box-containing protein
MTMKHDLRILFFEDTSMDVELEAYELQKAGISFTHKQVGSMSEFIAELDHFLPDLIISDYHLPDCTGSEALALVQATHPDIPVIMVTGALPDVEAVELIKSGAKDYVLKDRMARLGMAVQRVMSLEEAQAERRRAEKSLHESEAKFRALVESSSDWVWEIDHNGKCRYSSPQATAITGFTQDEILAADTFLLIADPEGAQLRAGVCTQRAITLAPHSLIAKNGRLIHFETSGTAVIGDGGAITGFRGISRDITEKKKAEQLILATRDVAVQLAASTDVDDLLNICLEHVLRLTGMTIGAGFTIDPSTGGKMRVGIGMSPELNDAWKTLAPNGPLHIHLASGQSIIHDMASPVNAWTDDLLSRFAQMNQHRTPNVILSPIWNGTRSWGCLMVATQASEQIDSRLVTLVETIAAQAGDAMARISSEITRRNLEAQLRQIQKMEAVGQLAGGLAHDFNNILGVIMSGLEVLARKLSLTGDTADIHAMIMQAVHRAADLTAKLLVLSRKSPPSTKPCNVHHIIQDAGILLRRGIDPRIALRFNLSASSSIVHGDSAQLQSLVLNLGINARDAMPSGGDIIISTYDDQISEEACSTTFPGIQPGRYLRIEVHDSGIGIPSEIRERIFEPFFTTKEPGKGTGLGLAMVYNTVQEHHGTIAVSSEPGCGTTFSIYLPVQEGAEPENEDRNGPLVSGHGLVMLVEDEPLLRTLNSKVLEEFGYDVVVANDGKHGVEVASANLAHLDLAIIDMMMPRMNGQECFTEIRRFAPDLPVIFMSGFSSSSVIEDLMKKTLVWFVPKPCSALELSRVIAKALATRRGSEK